MTKSTNNNKGIISLGGAILTVIALFSLWNPLMDATDNVYTSVRAIDYLNNNGDIAIEVFSKLIVFVPFALFFGTAGVCLSEFYRFGKGRASMFSISIHIVASVMAMGLMLYAGFVAATVTDLESSMFAASMMMIPLMLPLSMAVLTAVKVWQLITKR